MPATCTTACHSALSEPAARPARSLSLRARLAGAISLARQRRALARLDPALLADIGLTRDEALAEASRPVWDAPEYWGNIR